MMFMAMLFVIIAIILFIVGILSFIINIVLTVVFATVGKKNKVCKVLKFICPVISIGSLILLVPFGLLAGWFISKYSTIPDSYIECTTTIEFTSEGFQTDTGEEYVSLEYKPNYYDEMYALKVAVFSYKPKGFLNKYKWRNVYEIPTEHGFTLYSASDEHGWQTRIYAKKEEETLIHSYYENNYYWRLEDEKDQVEDSVLFLIEKYEHMNSATEIWAGDGYVSIDLVACSTDQRLIINECTFFFNNGKAYISTYTIFSMYYQYYGYELEGEEKEIAEKNIYFVQLSKWE